MTARFMASVAFSLVLASVAAGCTVHTYSGPAPRGTTYTRSEPIRYEVSYRSRERGRDRERGYAVPDERRPARSDAQESEDRTEGREVTARDRDRWTSRDAHGSNTSWGRVSTSPRKTDREREAAAAKPASDKPSVSPRSSTDDSTDDRRDGAATLKPTKQRDKYGRMRSFDERLGEVFEQKKAEIAREKKARQARMERAVGAATDKNR